MHGPGLKWNLLSSHNDDNVSGGYESEIEKPVKDKMAEDPSGVFYFKVDVKHYRKRSEIDTQAVKDNLTENELDFDKIAKLYEQLPFQLEVEAHKLKKKNNGGFEKDIEIHKKGTSFTFGKKLDVALAPGLIKQTIRDQGEANNGQLKIPLNAGRIIIKHRTKSGSVDDFVKALRAENDLVKTLDTKKEYLESIVRALAGSTNEKPITFIDEGVADDEILAFKKHIQAMETDIEVLEAKEKEEKEKRIKAKIAKYEEIIAFLAANGEKTSERELTKYLSPSRANLGNYRRGDVEIPKETLSQILKEAEKQVGKESNIKLDE